MKRHLFTPFPALNVRKVVRRPHGLDAGYRALGFWGAFQHDDACTTAAARPSSRRARPGAWAGSTSYLAMRGGNWTSPVISLVIFGVVLTSIGVVLTRGGGPPVILVRRPGVELADVLAFLAVYAVAYLGWGVDALRALPFPRALPAGGAGGGRPFHRGEAEKRSYPRHQSSDRRTWPQSTDKGAIDRKLRRPRFGEVDGRLVLRDRL